MKNNIIKEKEVITNKQTSTSTFCTSMFTKRLLWQYLYFWKFNIDLYEHCHCFYSVSVSQEAQAVICGRCCILSKQNTGMILYSENIPLSDFGVIKSKAHVAVLCQSELIGLLERCRGHS